MEGTSTAGSTGTITKAGTPVAGDVQLTSTPPKSSGDDQQKADSDAAAAAAKAAADSAKSATDGGGAGAGDGGAGAGNGDAAPPADLPEISDEQLQALLAKKGIDGFGDLTKLPDLIKKATAVTPPEKTDEEKAKDKEELEKRMLQLHLEVGGKAEEFVSVQQLLAADPKALSKSEVIRELKAEGFADSEIDKIIEERYYVIDPEKLVQGEEESQEDFAKRKANAAKKATYGAKKFEGKSAGVINQAKNFYDTLKKAIEAKDSLAANEAKFVSNVEAFAKSLPGEMTFELGELNDQKLDPVKVKVTAEEIDAVVNILKDPSQREKQFFNSDNSLNIESVGKLLLRNKLLEKALKVTYQVGGDKQVEAFKKTFGGQSPHDIGVGAGRTVNTQNGKPKVAKAGAPEFGVRQQ